MADVTMIEEITFKYKPVLAKLELNIAAQTAKLNKVLYHLPVQRGHSVHFNSNSDDDEHSIMEITYLPKEVCNPNNFPWSVCVYDYYLDKDSDEQWIPGFRCRFDSVYNPCVPYDMSIEDARSCWTRFLNLVPSK